MNLEKRTLSINTGNDILNWCAMQYAKFKAFKLRNPGYKDHLAVFDMNRSDFGLSSSRFWDKEKRPARIRIIVNKSNLLGNERAIRTNDWEFIYSVVLGHGRKNGESND